MEAVRCEPVSAENSLLYGNLQGIFVICRILAHWTYRKYPLDGRSTPEIPYAKNREFSVGFGEISELSSEIWRNQTSLRYLVTCCARKLRRQACGGPCRQGGPTTAAWVTFAKRGAGPPTVADLSSLPPVPMPHFP